MVRFFLGGTRQHDSRVIVGYTALQKIQQNSRCTPIILYIARKRGTIRSKGCRTARKNPPKKNATLTYLERRPRAAGIDQGHHGEPEAFRQLEEAQRCPVPRWARHACQWQQKRATRVEGGCSCTCTCSCCCCLHIKPFFPHISSTPSVRPDSSSETQNYVVTDSS